MKIQELYDREISRRINPAVVVSEMEDYYISQEIDEYVFTPVITKNIYKFLNALANKKEGKTGVWISGYYGSGKSHFIKYLFYCLNRAFREKAFENFSESVKELDPLEEPNPGLIRELRRKLDALTIEELIFNIDAVSDHYDEKDRITRVLLNQLNAFRGYNDNNIALALYLEKPLDNKGQFEAFKEKIKSTFGENWEGNQLRFVNRYLKSVIEIAKEFDSDIDSESLSQSIRDKDQDYTIEFLIDELQDYLQTRGEDYRLIFLIDEVSQYIGSNTSLLLNLQTIVEEIGSRIGPKVWIVCTAQQDLSNLIDNTDTRTEDFGKILGRFETMISLESQDAAFITKKRILDKNSGGIEALSTYYQANKGAIENQFVFDHDLYENYENRNDFLLTYPFIPYQFRLVSDVFESFSQVGYVGEGVKNTERAILGITHYTANLCKEKEIGYFVPFDLFFNEQLEKNLTHHARGILDRAYNIEQVKSDPFARRVVNTLFMISNMGESQSVNFPANLENLALLLMQSVDDPKLDMQNKVQEVLDVLVKKNIIQVSEGKYRFLKEDEIEVANLIKSTPVTAEDRLSYIYDDVIDKVVKPKPLVSFGNKNFKIAISIDDKEIGARGDFNLKFSLYDTAELENMAHTTATNDLIIGISEWFRHDQDLSSKVLEYVRTQKYIRLNSSSATGTRSETLSNFRETNKILLDEIKHRFEKKFLQTAIISNQQVIQATELQGNNPAARFDDIVKRHMEGIYRKNSLSLNYATSNTDLITQARSTQRQIDQELSPAEEELNTKLDFLGEGPVVGDIVRDFEKAPYGWKDISTLDVLLRLGKKGVRRFEWRNEEIDLVAFAEKALNSRERDAITIHKEKVHSREEVEAFIKVVNDEVFAETMVPSDTREYKEAVENFKRKLEPKLALLNRFKEEYEAYPFAIHPKQLHKSLSEIYQTRNPEQVVEKVIQEKSQLQRLRDTFKYVEEFIEHNFSAYQEVRRFALENKENFSSLTNGYEEKAALVLNYLGTDHEPWEKFPQIKKAYKELKEALEARVGSLKEEVISRYQEIFRNISEKKKELGLESSSLTTDPELFLQQLKKETRVSQLEVYEAKADDFKAQNYKILADHKAKLKAQDEGEPYKTSVTVSLSSEFDPVTVETPEQLDAFIKKLREKLMVKLSKNTKIFLK
jgi:hypothetical protein